VAHAPFTHIRLDGGGTVLDLHRSFQAVFSLVFGMVHGGMVDGTSRRPTGIGPTRARILGGA